MRVTFADDTSPNCPSSSLLPPKSLLEIVEDKIINATLSSQTALDEFLKDFDRLRTGFVTKEQFDRCLNQHFNIVLEANEDEIFMQKYGQVLSLPGMVNYRSLCQTIDLACQPKTNSSKEPDALECIHCVPCKSSLEQCKILLERIAPYYQYHGISVKSCYKDFDLHNIGLVTESQFYRCFPGPSDVNTTEQRLLAHHYSNSKNKGMCNYLDFHQDVFKIINASNETQKLLQPSDLQKVSKGKVFNNATIEDVFKKIEIATFKNGIRSTEFFKDHDKLRSGLVTRNQFICGINLCCGGQASLSSYEIDLLVDHFITDDGQVQYRDFCHQIENAFNIPDLEKNPTLNVYRPPIGALAQKPNMLSNEEEEKVNKILFELQEVVQKKRLMLYPYFKDFDQDNCYTQGITKTRFSRMLHMVGLDIKPADLEVVYRKFKHPVSGDINYPAFIQCIDQEYCAKAPVDGDWNTTKFDVKNSNLKEDIPNESVVDLNDLISRIQHHVFVNRIRTEEFFQDFDPLHHGSIPISRFCMSLSAMGHPPLSSLEMQAVLKKYQDSNIKQNVLWVLFLKDIDKVFTQKDLDFESLIMRPGASNWEAESEETKNAFNSVMKKMQQKIEQRRILTKPFFQDFDKHHLGYVTKYQFCQCLTYLSLSCDESEIGLLCKKFSDAAGFNYILFLDELQPSEKCEHKYVKRLEELKLSNQTKRYDESKEDVSDVMNKIQSKVFRESVRIHEFMKDFDKLRTGRMLKTNFPRALNISSLKLTAGDINTIMDCYTSEGDSNYVDYYRFCDDVESVFTTKGLEKNPTLIPIQFKPQSENSLIQLSSDAEEMIEAVIHRLGDRVKIRRIQIFPLFEDYDRVHNGTVSRSQLHRVLSELELGSIVSEREFHALYEKFLSVIGGKHDFNYKAFCDMVNSYAQFDPNIP